MDGSFNTQPPEGGWNSSSSSPSIRQCFNTQPPEGGWLYQSLPKSGNGSFNTQPPEGGWYVNSVAFGDCVLFQHTAARRRLEPIFASNRYSFLVSTHSRPKAAGTRQPFGYYAIYVSTHSRPKAAGSLQRVFRACRHVSTHSRPKAAGIHESLFLVYCDLFQHTAARRRLASSL